MFEPKHDEPAGKGRAGRRCSEFSFNFNATGSARAVHIRAKGIGKPGRYQDVGNFVFAASAILRRSSSRQGPWHA